MSGEKSERGKYSVQIWQSDPMNSPKAFGELKILGVAATGPLFFQSLSFYLLIVAIYMTLFNSNLAHCDSVEPLAQYSTMVPG